MRALSQPITTEVNMEHSIVIWSWLKKRNEDGKLNHVLESRFTLTEDELLEMVTDKWKADHEMYIKWDREYKAELEETKHN